MIETPQALFEFWARAVSKGPQTILQEYIPGEDWIYHGYCNAKMNLYVSFTGIKLLGYPAASGSTAIGVSCSNEKLRSQSELLLRSISYSGVTDMDWRRDERDGRFKIVDCNPRVGMNFRMFETNAGIDVIRAQHLNLTGRDIDCAQMIEGRRFIVEDFYLLSSIRRGRSGVSPGKVYGYQTGNRELAWWSRDDKLPFWTMTARRLPGIIRRKLVQMWR